ncbi:MAG: hypothetical protein C0501_30760 [Isosphaera sp.]|nr:hypothetical protein [Isosphaera sp.]
MRRSGSSTPPHLTTAPAAVEEAVALWVGYPLIGEGIECADDATPEEKYATRCALNRAHYRAAERLMLEAELAGLDPAPLSEARRVCQELFDPVRRHNPPSGSWGVSWFHHPRRVDDTWPACLGEWRYALPAAMQEAIRRGEEVFTRLATRLDVAPAEALAVVCPPGHGGLAKVGRPADAGKRQVVAFVRGLREKEPPAPWKEIPDLVFERFHKRYTSETLRGYLKGG